MAINFNEFFIGPNNLGIASYLWQDAHLLPQSFLTIWNGSFYIIPCDPNELQSFGLNRSSNLWLVDESEQKMLVFDWSCLSQAITKIKHVFINGISQWEASEMRANQRASSMLPCWSIIKLIYFSMTVFIGEPFVGRNLHLSFFLLQNML